MNPLPILLGTAALWGVLGARTALDLRRAPQLKPYRQAAPALPFVSLLMPARNEAGRLLTECIASLLAQDYPHFEIIAVDDRSDDDTGALLRSYLPSAGDRLTVLDGVEPSPGWVGKQNALMVAAREARGEWLLCVDADAVYGPGVLRDAVCHALYHEVDALSVLPRAGVGDFWVSVTYPLGVWSLHAGVPFRSVNGTNRGKGMAWGGFFLIRRDTFDAVGGFAPVAGETSEDTKMASYLKSRGYRLRVELATERIFTPMYPTLRDLWAGTTKNVYAGPFWTPLYAILFLILGVLPLPCAVLAAASGDFVTASSAVTAWLLQAGALLPVYRLHRIPLWRTLCAPAGTAILVAQLLRTTWMVAVTGRGIEWRGRRLRARPESSPAPALVRSRSQH